MAAVVVAVVMVAAVVVITVGVEAVMPLLEPLQMCRLDLEAQQRLMMWTDTPPATAAVHGGLTLLSRRDISTQQPMNPKQRLHPLI